MIYDCKEIFMDINDLLYTENNAVISYRVDYEGLDEGKRILAIPEGVGELCGGAFSEYNSSELVESISRNLIMPEQYINDWAKRLTRKNVVRIQFPEEVGKSVRKRAEYMVEKERRVRFLCIDLPASLNDINYDSFPVLLEDINVDEKNESFASVEGVLFSKDMKTLIRYPGYKNIDVYMVPAGVETIAAGAFETAFINCLILPESLRIIEANAFCNSVIGHLVVREGLETIEGESFINCDIKEIVLPSTVKIIKDYAFKGTSGIRQMACDSEELSIGIGVFSGGNFTNVEWWPWEVIPKATFLNARIKSINIPEGVEIIDDYAFAGCYKAEGIIIPESVKEIGKWSFDEGATFSADVTLPDTLYKYAYRFPALSKINKKMKSEIYEAATDQDFREDFEVLQKQKENIEKYIGSLNILQGIKKTVYEKEVKYIDNLIERR